MQGQQSVICRIATNLLSCSIHRCSTLSAILWHQSGIRLLIPFASLSAAGPSTILHSVRQLSSASLSGYLHAVVRACCQASNTLRGCSQASQPGFLAAAGNRSSTLPAGRASCVCRVEWNQANQQACPAAAKKADKDRCPHTRARIRQPQPLATRANRD